MSRSVQAADSTVNDKLFMFIYVIFISLFQAFPRIKTGFKLAHSATEVVSLDLPREVHYNTPEEEIGFGINL